MGSQAHSPQRNKGKIDGLRPVALMVERRSPKPDVVGSSPTWPGSKKRQKMLCLCTAEFERGPRSRHEEDNSVLQR